MASIINRFDFERKKSPSKRKEIFFVGFGSSKMKGERKE